MAQDDSLSLGVEGTSPYNETLALLGKRFSTRNFVQGGEGAITGDEKSAILKAALRAPTAGNMLAYSIIDITDQHILERLAVLCDNQPFIATAPLALIFVADYQKWTDLFDATDCERHIKEGKTKNPHAHTAPGQGALMLAINDALIAAQNAVIAAESLGIGSCYIGDIMEQGPALAELLNLPTYTFPAALVVFGRAKKQVAPTSHFIEGAVMSNGYERCSGQQLEERVRAITQWAPASRMSPEFPTYPEALFVRKHGSDFMAEMDASVQWWIDRWLSGLPTTEQR